MAKKKKNTDTPSTLASWKPPTSQERRRMAAEDAARVAVDTDPEVKKVREKKQNEITDAILAVMSHKLT